MKDKVSNFVQISIRAQLQILLHIYEYRLADCPAFLHVWICHRCHCQPV